MKDHNLIINRNKKYNIIAVKDRAEDDRPREKMLKSGAESLNSAELLAIILNSGTKKEEVLNMAHRILKEYGKNSIINEINSMMPSLSPITPVFLSKAKTITKIKRNAKIGTK